MPWRETVVTQAPEALYVMYPKSDGWGMQAVPRELGAFDNRRDLPAAWAGLSGDELAAATGVPDARVLPHRRASTSRPAAARASPSSPGARWTARGNGSRTGVPPRGWERCSRLHPSGTAVVKVVITGATGNVGTSLLAALRTETASRRSSASPGARPASTSPASGS